MINATRGINAHAIAPGERASFEYFARRRMSAIRLDGRNNGEYRSHAFRGADNNGNNRAAKPTRLEFFRRRTGRDPRSRVDLAFPRDREIGGSRYVGGRCVGLTSSDN